MPLMPNVGTGQVIQTTWGNDIRDRTVQRFASSAALTSGWPGAADGSVAYLEDSDTFWGRAAGVWVCLSPRRYRSQLTTSSGNVSNTPLAVPGYSVSFTAAAGGTHIDIRTEMAVVLASGANQAMLVELRVDSTVVGGRRSNVNTGTWGFLAAGANNVTVAAGTHTVQVYLACQSAGSTGNIFATATEPAWLEVIDRG